MALIKCPECNREISDKVKNCPHCGYPLTKSEDDTQKVEISSVNIKIKEKNKRKIVLTIIIICCVILGIIGGVQLYKNQKAKADSQKYEEMVKSYIDNIKLLEVQMIAVGSEAEDLLNLTSRVWSNAIFEKEDSETNKYTKSNGAFVSDFNTAIINIFSDSEIQEKIADIEKGQDNVSSLLKTLQEVPEGYEKIYDTITELSTAFRSLTDFAINPQGNLQTFNSTKQEKIDDFMDLYNKLETQMPD